MWFGATSLSIMGISAGYSIHGTGSIDVTMKHARKKSVLLQELPKGTVMSSPE